MSARPQIPSEGNTSSPLASAADQIVHHSDRTRIVRRRLPGAAGSVLLKEPLGDAAPQRLRAERHILERLASVQGVPRLAPAATTATQAKGPSDTLAIEDAGGVPLRDALHAQALSLPARLDIAWQLTRILAEVHRLGVSHRNINPSHVVLVDGAPGTCGPPAWGRPAPTRHPLLIGFGMATTAAMQQTACRNPHEITGLLACLAPEQTGRTGRSVDPRTDLYGLGATLYELFTGRAPFDDNDPLQLIHDILAQVPTRPIERVPDMPQALSDIVMRLLEKEPDRRYQSAEGLAHDLGLLRDRLATGEPVAFLLGEHDFAARLSPPARPIGREAELAALQGAFAHTLQGRGRGVMIAGSPGVGKTMLISELRPLVTARRGWFVTGKFDQYRRDQATDGVYQALRALGRLLLAEPEAELAMLRSKMLRELGPNAGLAASKPEFALLLGIAPITDTDDDPVKAQQRRVQGALELLRCIASPERPVVLILDDLQWAATLPLAFVDAILTDVTLRGVLLVGAYREAEVDVAHPLTTMRSRWERLGVAPLSLNLHNLPPADLGELIGEMLRLPPAAAAALAAVLTERTAGNPFDTVELLNALRHDGALVRAHGGWHWDCATIRQHVGSGDVLDLLAARIERLPLTTQDALATMSCLGGEVELGLLRAAVGASAEALDECIAPALEDGLLVQESVGDGALRFRHDRVQQAANDRMDAATRQALKLALARRLATHGDFDAAAAAQYLAVTDALHEAPERRQAARLFHSAATQVRTINDARSERFLAGAIGLLAGLDDAADAALAAAIEIEQHAVLYSLGRLEEADGVYRSIEGRRSDALDPVNAGCVQVRSLVNRQRQREGLTLGVGLLRRLGLAVPQETDVRAGLEPALARFYRWMADDARADDLRRPELHDPRLRMAAKLANVLLPAALSCDRMMIAWLTLESQRLWAEHGPCASLVASLAWAPNLTVAVRGDYATGYAAARRVMAVGEARRYEPETSQARFLLSAFSMHWFEPLEACLHQAHVARDGLLRGGDLQSAALTYNILLFAMFESAPTLAGCAAEIESALAFTARTGNAYVMNYARGERRFVQWLTGEGEAPGSIGHSAPQEAAPGAPSNPIIASFVHVSSGVAAAVFGDGAELARHATAAMTLLPHIQGFYRAAIVRLLQALALAERMQAAEPAERAALLIEFDACRDWMASRAADAPANFLHLLRWIDAERAWAVGDIQAVACRFDDALQEGAKVQRPWHNALLAERAARFMRAHGMAFAGRQMLAEAHRRYKAWGAAAKVRQLEHDHAFLTSAEAAGRAGDRGQRQSLSADAIDLLGIVRASQALSSETHLDRLQLRVIELLGELTGATRVHVMLWNDEAQAWLLAQPGAAGLTTAEADARGLLPLSAFRYAERTREPLLVEDATHDDRFASDPYLRGVERCSLMVVPILNHGTARALLILENRLSRAAFTADRLDAVMLITGQLAVSLANAQLYEQLERRVRERTQELQHAQTQLLAAARQAGMAEIATNVLHNVGNVLNSVNVSANLVGDRLRTSKVKGLARAVRLMDERAGDLGDFMTRDAKGKLIPSYLRELAQTLEQEHEAMARELSTLSKSVDHIKEVVATQQSYAGAPRFIESVQLAELVDDALRMNAGALTRHKVDVVTNLAELPALPLDRHRVLQILVNLISNAKHAMSGVDDQADHNACITLDAHLADTATGQVLHVTVADNGEGIPPENLTRVFSHGFTTRKNGHGFGLHSCVLAAQEMGGSLSAHSAGSGRGASFTLEIPIDVPESQP